jgi:uncharacterized cupredoxin-like copper-binding protein
MRIAALVAVLFLLVSCGGGSETMPADVNVVVEMKDYSITLSVPNVKAGTVKFGIRNSGGMEHSFELIKTDLDIDKLPVADAKAKEDGLVKQIKSIPVAKIATISADLQPGKYVVICNVAGHYQLGMRAGLRVD